LGPPDGFRPSVAACISALIADAGVTLSSSGVRCAATKNIATSRSGFMAPGGSTRPSAAMTFSFPSAALSVAI